MQVIFRALAVLQCIAAAPAPPTLNEISHRLDMPAPTVHRLLAALMSEEYVIRDAMTKRFSAGPAMMTLSPRAQSSRLSDIGARVTQDLASRFDETAYVSALEGDRAVCIARVESRRPLRLNMNVAALFPWHASAGARTILAFLPADYARRLLESRPLERYTDNTPQSIAEVEAHLEKIRELGYDICDDELDHGVWAAAAPVFGPDREILGSVGVGGVATRLRSAESRNSVIEAVVEAAHNVSAELGGVPRIASVQR